MRDSNAGTQHDDHERLLLSVVEQLCKPLLQVSRLSELAGTAGQDFPHDEAWHTVQAVAGSGLHLVESYALSLRLQGRLSLLEVEPVTVSSLLYDAAEALRPYAKQYGVELDLDTGPRLAPILGDRNVLHSAMVSLGQVFVEATAEREGDERLVRLAAHHGRYGVVAGLYGSAQHVGAESLRRARAMQGRARQPLQQLVSGPAAGVFVADSLLHTLSSRLHVARYRKLTGLAATLAPSQQLQLV